MSQGSRVWDLIHYAKNNDGSLFDAGYTVMMLLHVAAVGLTALVRQQIRSIHVKRAAASI
jgi:hypothetical protein